MRNSIYLKVAFFICFYLLVGSACGLGPKKQISAVKTDQPPKINGILDETCWAGIPVANNFVQYSPYNGEASTKKTEIKLLYDNSGIYIAAVMHDSSPDSIYRELGERDADRRLNADHFSIDISPFNDGVNGLTFKVSASGVQTDIKRSPMGRHGQDTNWDAVWESAVSINEDGWIAEIKIPYSALRFPNKNTQLWGINFWREIRRNREWSSWNYVDREVGNTFNHMGELTGIDEVKPPLRLSVTPYLSGYLEKNPENTSWVTNFNGGMDLKYGINNSFTLDATLIPDFGQVESDDVILNLSPFEVKYNEKRQFFTEGSELFNKGGVFYSRRIGSIPGGYDLPESKLGENEEIISNPTETLLINASKISGRTKGGLGIGVFNAMSAKTVATIRNIETDKTQEMETQPFTNYNLLVLDQNLGNNSYVSLINSNVYRNAFRNDYNYTANVTATDFKLLTKNNLYSVSGKGAISQKYYDSLDTDLGHMYEFTIGKTGGSFRAEYSQEISSDSYDPNDLGYLRRNNEFTHQLEFGYNIYKPVGKILDSRNSFSLEYAQLYSPRKYTSFQMELNTFTTFVNYFTTRLELQYEPYGMDDYFEPRVDGRMYHREKSISVSGWISTDYRKRFYSRFTLDYERIYSGFDQKEYRVEIEPTFRLNDRFKLSHEFGFTNGINDMGYVDISAASDSVFFGKRNIITISNTFESTYIFSNTSYLSFRLRHYWSRADYDNSFYLLDEDGSLNSDSYSGDHDRNFNVFNIDLAYTWRFAPGSEMSVVWKNSIYQDQDEIMYGFLDNLSETLKSPQVNSFSIKILYYLDYQYLKPKV